MPDWQWRLERRARPSTFMRIASPPLAVLAMFITGLIAFAFLDQDPLGSCYVYFIQPLSSMYGLGELLLKATPLCLCALGLALGFRANIWNIGAEGQFTLGAIAGTGVGLFWGSHLGPFAIPAMLAAGALGGMAWAAIPAVLRARFNTSEILVSLMLVYIAQLLLSWLVRSPWRDPAGFNFPQSRVLEDNLLLPTLIEGTRVHIGAVLALVVAGASWIFTSKSFAGYRMQVAGLAPAAARYAGFSSQSTVWLALLASGATAGLAGVCEIAGPIGRLQPSISPGYGFAAIIVAVVGRLHPVGIVLASLLMSLLYLGGESVQLELQLPSAITGIFQGTLLFYLLAADLFVGFRLRRVRPERARTSIDTEVVRQAP